MEEQQQTDNQQQPLMPSTTVQETAEQKPSVSPTMLEATAQETAEQKPPVSPTMLETTAEKMVEQPIEVGSHRNNQPQLQPVLVYNPSIRLTPRHEPADVIPSKPDSSLINWLETSGRMLPRDPSETETYLEEEEEISELIAVDDNSYDDDDLEDDADEPVD